MPLTSRLFFTSAGPRAPAYEVAYEVASEVASASLPQGTECDSLPLPRCLMGTTKWIFLNHSLRDYHEKFKIISQRTSMNPSLNLSYHSGSFCSWEIICCFELSSFKQWMCGSSFISQLLFSFKKLSKSDGERKQ